jgi:predicted RNA-binding protein with TRAM domain
MEISDELRCLFSGRVQEQDGSYVVEIPERELRHGSLRRGGTYQVAVLDARSDADDEEQESTPDSRRRSDAPTPPVEEGETRTVEIEDIGDQGDGITRVERGFVVIVPDTEQSERVRVDITDVRENVAFAEVVERLSYYE